MNELIQSLVLAYPDIEIRIRKPSTLKYFGTYFEFMKRGEAPILVPSIVHGAKTLMELIEKIKKLIQECSFDETFTHPLVFIETNTLSVTEEFCFVKIGIIVYGD